MSSPIFAKEYSPFGGNQIIEEKDEFPYGWRCVPVVLANGTTDYQYIPLTLADTFDPQEGDQMIQNTRHAQCVLDLFQIFQLRYQDDPTIGVFCDLKMCWELTGLPEPSPDLAIIPNIRQKQAYRGRFRVPQEGTRPCLIIEVMSPQYPGDDTKKVKIYQRAKIPEYFLINPSTADYELGYELTAYRLRRNKYQLIEPNNEGYWHSQTTDVLFGISADRQRLLLKDARTGECLLMPTELAEARSVAETRAQTEAQAEAQARQAAEVRAQAEAQARHELERRLRELEAKLK